MTDIAKHIRIFEPTAGDDFVNKRIEAIKTLEAEYRKKKLVNDNLIFADAIGNLLLDFSQDPRGISSLVGTAIKKHSTSFVAEGAELEIVTCALLGFVQWIENNGNADPMAVNDVAAISLWSCLSFQAPLDSEPKLEALRRELIEVSQKRIENTSINSRLRNEVKSVAPTTAPDDGTVATFNNTLNATYNKVINNLRKNAILDREEIDCLWWVVAEWSNIANAPLQSLNSIQKAILSGIELARILRRVPGISHRNLLTRFLDESPIIDANEMLAGLGDMTELIKEYLTEFTIISDAKLTFPLFNTIKLGSNGISGSDIKRPLSEWAFRALIEGSMINLNTIVADAK